MNKEDLIGKYGYIEKLHKLLILFEMKENSRVALYLHCLTGDSNVNIQNTYLVAMLLNTLWHATEDSLKSMGAYIERIGVFSHL